jgi:broad specificity phosphatase PhoE
MKIFLIRHGETGWKKIGFLSYTDIGLSEKGLCQTKKIAQKLENENIDAIYSSPLKRCRQTAKEIAKKLGLKILIAPELREVNFGIFEGLSLEEAERKYPDLFLKRLKDKWNFKIPKGESYKEAAARVLKFLKKISKSKKNKNIVLVTHVTIIKILLKLFSNLSMEEIDKIHFLPTSVTILEKKGKKFQFSKINDYSHLEI